MSGPAASTDWRVDVARRLSAPYAAQMMLVDVRVVVSVLPALSRVWWSVTHEAKWNAYLPAVSTGGARRMLALELQACEEAPA